MVLLLLVGPQEARIAAELESAQAEAKAAALREKQEAKAAALRERQQLITAAHHHELAIVKYYGLLPWRCEAVAAKVRWSIAAQHDARIVRADAHTHLHLHTCTPLFKHMAVSFCVTSERRIAIAVVHQRCTDSCINVN